MTLGLTDSTSLNGNPLSLYITNKGPDIAFPIIVCQNEVMSNVMLFTILTVAEGWSFVCALVIQMRLLHNQRKNQKFELFSE
jgi:hypothetical protein